MNLGLDFFRRRDGGATVTGATHLPQPVDIAEIRGAILSKIVLACGKDVNQATKHDWYVATVLTLRDRIVHQWLRSQRGNQDRQQAGLLSVA